MKIDCTRDARIFVNSAIQSHSVQWTRIRNTTEYLMEYKRPADEEEIKERKATWQNNWNYGKGRMLVEQGVISNVLNMILTLGMMEIDFVEFDEAKHKKPYLQFLTNRRFRYIFGNIICDTLADTLERDPRFHDLLTLIEYNSYCFGYGPVVRDQFSYLGKAIFLNEIAFEDHTDLFQVFNWVIFDVIKGDFLIHKWDTISRLSLKKTPYTGDDCCSYNIYSNGWIEEGLLEIFCRILENNDEVRKEIEAGSIELPSKISDEKEGEIKLTTWEDVSAVRRHMGDVWLSLNVNNIPIAKIFNTESDGSITETYMVSRQGLFVEEDQEGGIAYTSMDSQEYLLFRKNRKKIPYTRLLNLIKEFGVRSERYIQNLKGASKQLTEESIRYDMKRNAVEDKLLVQGSLILSKTDELNDAALEVFGGYLYLPPGVQFAPNQIKIELSDHIQSLSTDEQDFQRRISHYNPQLKLSNRPTKDEVQLQSSQHNFQRQSKIPSKLKDYGILFYNILLDLVNGTYENQIDVDCQNYFIKTLESRFSSEFDIDKKDVKDVLKQVLGITLHQVNTNTQSIQSALPFAQNSEGRDRLMKSFLLSLGFSRQDVNLFIEVVNYSHQIEQAANENAAFYNTSEVVFDESQDHIGHLDTHYPKIDRIIKGIQGGEDIVKGFHYITNALTNTEKHLGSIQNSPFFKRRFADYKKYQDAFTQTAKQIAEMINKKKEENAKNGGNDMSVDPVALKKMQILEWQAQQKNARTNWLTSQATERKMAEFKQKMEMKIADHQLDSSIKKDLADTMKELELLKQSVKIT